MGSKYAPSLRLFLPLWTLLLEAAFILTFMFLIPSEAPANMLKDSLELYSAFQDVNVMAVLGFGFLVASLRRFSWSGLAFNLFLVAVGVQWTVLLDGFLFHFSAGKLYIGLRSLLVATMSVVSVLISAGAILGQANVVQLLVMTLVEVSAFSITRWLSLEILQVETHEFMMYVHIFGAYFGLMVAWFLWKPLPKEALEKAKAATTTGLFSMLGTLFLWMFWPTFNSVLLDVHVAKKAVFNTYYAIAASAVTAIALSAAAHSRGKIDMVDVHNATLAGGVAVGPTARLIESPALAMALGLVAGSISVLGAKCLPVCFNRVLKIHDTCGVHSTFGLPGLLGGVAYIGFNLVEASWTNFTKMGYQALLDAGSLSLAVAMSLATGVLTGLLLMLKIWKTPHVVKHFDDQAFWEFPHLAVGY
ncbi:blood group Rh(CE) polypeptide [Tachyglossus aculeatus]|uniref:blood group Rh(CE) polypeptide n=1 Tax=Tachyglossus aculeatus TaxID=9261 RepID=UPI0018F78C78|nr:blood group Rh(CE) polypeptide [Tachyglossus aculeatus]